MQVYKAVLRATGEEVAIKVQRPGVEPLILMDLLLLRTLALGFTSMSRQVGARRGGGPYHH